LPIRVFYKFYSSQDELLNNAGIKKEAENDNIRIYPSNAPFADTIALEENMDDVSVKPKAQIPPKAAKTASDEFQTAIINSPKLSTTKSVPLIGIHSLTDKFSWSNKQHTSDVSKHAATTKPGHKQKGIEADRCPPRIFKLNSCSKVSEFILGAAPTM